MLYVTVLQRGEEGGGWGKQTDLVYATGSSSVFFVIFLLELGMFMHTLFD